MSIKERIEEIKGMGLTEAIKEVISIARDYNKDEVIADIVEEEQITEHLKKILNDGGSWQAVAITINGIATNRGDNYYRMDGYGNYKAIDFNRVDLYIDELEEVLQDEILEEQEEEQEEE